MAGSDFSARRTQLACGTQFNAFMEVVRYGKKQLNAVTEVVYFGGKQLKAVAYAGTMAGYKRDPSLDAAKFATTFLPFDWLCSVLLIRR